MSTEGNAGIAIWSQALDNRSESPFVRWDGESWTKVPDREAKEDVGAKIAETKSGGTRVSSQEGIEAFYMNWSKAKPISRGFFMLDVRTRVEDDSGRTSYVAVGIEADDVDDSKGWVNETVNIIQRFGEDFGRPLKTEESKLRRTLREVIDKKKALYQTRIALAVSVAGVTTAAVLIWWMSSN
jgi:hypothetical protein